MIVLNKIDFDFGGRRLFDQAAWHIKPGEKTGLVGANGTGKTTLLKIISGEYSVSGGEITRRRNLQIGFLNQEMLSFESDFSILHEALTAFEQQNEIHDKIEEVLLELNHNHSEELLHKLDALQTQYESLDGYNLQYKAEAVLEGLGFVTSDLKRPLKEFSGGWRMRVMLAKMLLSKPDLLLLDEPTNHLDLPSIQWLEAYLASYERAVIIVSHDRYFLDNVVQKIAEVEHQKITLYTGNYSAYTEQKSVRDEMQQNRFENQQRYLKEQEMLIDRFRYKASKAKMAQARIKMLDRIERVDEVKRGQSSMNLDIRVKENPGKEIVTIDIREKNYGSLCVFKNTGSQVMRGDKIALIGKNGFGKSTLLRMLAGAEPFDGDLKTGYRVSTSYYAQHQLSALNVENTLLEEMQQFAPGKTDNELRSLLGALLFPGEDIFKKIKILSGGEKARAALAKTILSGSNFLLLDEPGNHLDLLSVNILKDALLDYDGTFIIVSHDRYLISSLARKIWYIEDFKITEYPGTYEEYEWWLEEKKQAKKSDASVPVKSREKSISENDLAPVKKVSGNRKNEIKKLQSRLETLESEMDLIGKKKEALISELSSVEVQRDAQKSRELNSELNELETRLNEHALAWEQLFNRLSDEENE